MTPEEPYMTGLNQNATAKDPEESNKQHRRLIRYKMSPAWEPVKKHSVIFLCAGRYLDASMHDELQAINDDLRIEFLGIKND